MISVDIIYRHRHAGIQEQYSYTKTVKTSWYFNFVGVYYLEYPVAWIPTTNTLFTLHKVLVARLALPHTIPRHVTLHTLTGSLVETSPVWSKDGPVVKHLTLLEESHAGRVVLQGHLHHSGILHHCIRGHQKQL